MENLNAEQAINELEFKTKYAKFIESKVVLLSAKCAQFALDNIKYYEQRIEELAAENVYGLPAKELAEKCENLCIELEAMRGAANSYKMHNKKLTEENENLHASCTELERKCASLNEECARLNDENERLSADKDYWKNRAKESESEYNQAVKRGYNLGAIDYVGSFAERLKAETITIQDHTGKLGSVILVSTIDQIAKEMLEELYGKGDNG